MGLFNQITGALAENLSKSNDRILDKADRLSTRLNDEQRSRLEKGHSNNQKLAEFAQKQKNKG